MAKRRRKSKPRLTLKALNERIDRLYSGKETIWFGHENSKNGKVETLGFDVDTNHMKFLARQANDISRLKHDMKSKETKSSVVDVGWATLVGYALFLDGDQIVKHIETILGLF